MITMAVNTIGLSREFIIHPGETLAEVIEDRDMSQHDLAVRTGMTEKHISTVINGQKNISPSFAKKLEYALGLDSSFWMNLQNNYDRELLDFEELNNISEDEIDLLSNLKDVSDVFIDMGFLQDNKPAHEMILDYRRLLGISNLLDIPKLSYYASFRAQTNNASVDPFVLFAWQKMCELLAEDIRVNDSIDVSKLRKMIPEIKKVMFLRADRIESRLTDIFSDCGISFRVVPNFRGAPVQGFIKRSDNGAVILCVTLRQKFADIFWFTLFHEIAHIINGDIKRSFIDFESVSENAENKADRLARDMLIDSKDYVTFVSSKSYEKTIEIKRFAESQHVKEYIVLGRLMKDKYIPWKDRTKYEWV